MQAETNRQMIGGKSKQLRGRARQWWGRVIRDDALRRSGRVEELMRVIQERYGFARRKAARQVDRFLRHIPHSS